MNGSKKESNTEKLVRFFPIAIAWFCKQGEENKADDDKQSNRTKRYFWILAWDEKRNDGGVGAQIITDCKKDGVEQQADKSKRAKPGVKGKGKIKTAEESIDPSCLCAQQNGDGQKHGANESGNLTQGNKDLRW